MPKKIHFYNSFEEQEKHELEMNLAMTPKERIILAVQLIKKVIKQESNDAGRRITFVKIE